jgi:ABC-2 type transport system ATP-binding protein
MEAASASEPFVVDVLGLTKVFRDFWRRPKVRAVDALDLQVRRGEVLGLLGPNGSGKSTTIKVLLGLLHPTSGTVRVLGQSPRDVSAKRQIGYLPEESYLYSYLTPRETLDFYGSLFGLDGATRRARAAELLAMAGLNSAADRPVGEFSKGMARRLGLAQALINDPALVLLDEPTAGLDPIACRQVKDLVRELAQRGKTVLMSSHLLADVEDVCDRVAIMYNGRLRAIGRLSELLEQKDRLRLTVPDLGPEATRQLLSLIRDRIGCDPELDRPSVNLEQFFLRVIAAAGQGPSSGAEVPRGIAEFLKKP